MELLDQSSNLSWLHGVNVFSIETHDRFRDNSTTTVLAAFPEDKFHRSQSGEFLVFSRKDVTTPDNLPDIIRISPRGSKSLSFERKNVNGAHWGFMAINDQKFQLHPNEPGEPPASIHFEISLSGHSRICARISLESDKAQPVVFKIILKTDQKTILNSEQVVYASFEI
ncbi:hypothetical protein [Acidiphilium acidophilum]|uniref:hypothetical protein n=1 Tax=Acidiphilium acidophilum TaxID=76588 RepID=UPI002E8E61BA|nr:hypothetical protein [Acidiphilium acidophilum]